MTRALMAALSAFAGVGALGACTDFDAYHLRAGLVCGSRFVDPAAGECAPGPPACGCDDPARSCQYEGPGFRCLPAGQRAAGAGCDADADCERGLACTGGVCRETCRLAADCTRTVSAECIQVSSVEGDDIPEFFVCTYDCDPVTPTDPVDPTGFAACEAGQTCSVSTIRHSACIASTGTSTGGACTADTDCAPGYGCFLEGCLRYCWLFAPECPTGTCEPVTAADGSPAVYLGVAALGVCL